MEKMDHGIHNSTSTRVIVNVSPTYTFMLGIGLCQIDYLSPLLFLNAAEDLDILLRHQ